MAWTETEHNEVVAGLTVTLELIGLTYSRPAVQHFLQSLERYPAEVVLKALDRASRELSRKDFCLSAVMQLAAAEKRAPTRSPALPASNPVSEDERKRNMRKVSEVCAWLAGDSKKPEWLDKPSKPHWSETERDQ